MAPISWLFSVASTGLVTPLALHLLSWILGLALGRKVLRAFLPESETDRLSKLWLALVVVVSFQVTTLFRPVVWGGDGQPFIDWKRKPFLEHFYDSLDVTTSLTPPPPPQP